MLECHPAARIDRDDKVTSTVPVWSDHYGAWVMGRYEDVRALLTDPRLVGGLAGYRPPLHPTPEERLDAAFSRWPVFSAGTQHRRLRKGAIDALSVIHATLHATVEQNVERLVTHLEVPSAGVIDISACLCKPLLTGLARDALKINFQQLGQAVGCGEALLGFLAREEGSSKSALRALQAVEELEELVRSNAFGVFGDEPGDHCPLSADDVGERAGIIAQLLTGTLGPTSVAITASLLAVGSDARLRASIRHGPWLEGLVEESLRFATPFHVAPRKVERALRYRGVDLAEGDLVMLRLLDANFDGEAYRNPERFDVERWPGAPPHTSFGRGPHACPGARLVRSAIASAVRAVVGRFPDIETIDYSYADAGDVTVFSRAVMRLVSDRQSGI